MKNSEKRLRDLVRHVQKFFKFFEVDEDKNLVRLIFPGGDGIFEVVCFLDGDLFVVVIRIPQEFPKGAHSELIEAISDANNFVKIGGFLFRRDEGQIVFRVANVIQDSLSDELIRSAISASVQCCQDFQRAFNSIVFANAKGSEAVDRVAKDLAAEQSR